MEKNERVKTAYEYLRNIGKVHTQQDLADSMGMKKESISRAFSGNESYLTDKFLYKFNQAFGNLFNIDWLLYEEGDMITHPIQSVGDISHSTVSGVNVNGKDIHIISPEAYQTLLKIIDSNQKTTEKFQEQIDRLITIIEYKYGVPPKTNDVDSR